MFYQHRAVKPINAKIGDGAGRIEAVYSINFYCKSYPGCSYVLSSIRPCSPPIEIRTSSSNEGRQIAVSAGRICNRARSGTDGFIFRARFFIALCYKVFFVPDSKTEHSRSCLNLPFCSFLQSKQKTLARICFKLANAL